MFIPELPTVATELKQRLIQKPQPQITDSQTPPPTVVAVPEIVEVRQFPLFPEEDDKRHALDTTG